MRCRSFSSDCTLNYFNDSVHDTMWSELIFRLSLLNFEYDQKTFCIQISGNELLLTLVNL